MRQIARPNLSHGCINGRVNFALGDSGMLLVNLCEIPFQSIGGLVRGLSIRTFLLKMNRANANALAFGQRPANQGLHHCPRVHR